MSGRGMHIDGTPLRSSNRRLGNIRALIRPLTLAITGEKKTVFYAPLVQIEVLVFLVAI